MGTIEFKFVLVDLTTETTADVMRPMSSFSAFVDAWLEQISGPYAESHGEQCVSFRIATSPDDRAPDEVAINFRDTIPEAPGALAYHTEINGIPDIEIGVDLFTSLLEGSDSVSCGGSHEILELLGNPGANGWKDNGAGMVDAEEECDFVQNTNYQASNGATVSNFLLPSKFIPGAPGPWDYLALMTSQDDVSNGYGIQAGSPSNIYQIGGFVTKAIQAAIHETHRAVTIKGSLSDLQKKRKFHPYARTYRIGARVA